MIVPTNKVREALQEMVASGELAPGDELPRHGAMCALFDLRRMQCSKVLWELTVNGEITRIDKRHFYGSPPANTRSKEQIQFVLLQMLADGQVAEGEEFPASLAVRTAFNTSAAIVQAVIKEIVGLGLVTNRHKCKRVEAGARHKAEQALEAFQFTLSVLESQVDECFERIETAATPALARQELRCWRSENKHKEEALFLAWQLRRRFDLESLSLESATDDPLSIEQLVERAQACRDWLRRHHVTYEGDGLLVVIASL